MVRELVKARLRVVQARQARQSGELADTPPVPVVDALEALEGAKGSDLAPADKPAHLLTLRDVYELWKAKNDTPASKSIDTALRVVEAFEEVTGNPPLPNNAGGALPKWFSEVKTAAGWGKEHTFHSFGHGVETALKRAKEPKSHIERYTGHAGDSVADRDYTHLEPEDLVETVLKMRPEGLELPRVFAPLGWTAPAATGGLVKAKSRRGSSL